MSTFCIRILVLQPLVLKKMANNPIKVKELYLGT